MRLIDSRLYRKTKPYCKNLFSLPGINENEEELELCFFWSVQLPLPDEACLLCEKLLRAVSPLLLLKGLNSSVTMAKSPATNTPIIFTAGFFNQPVYDVTEVEYCRAIKYNL